MSLAKRLIARLDVKGNKLIKGVRYEGLRVIGDPYNYASKYAKSGIDEIIYLDVVASLYGRNSLFEVLKKTSSNIFIPITAGGGIRSVNDAGKLLASGADKIAINTAALANPWLIKEISRTFGSQAVVVSIQARQTSNNTWMCMAEAGREKSMIDVIEWIKQVQDLGAGEILLTSVDNDGTCTQPDYHLIEAAQHHVKVPLVVSGGFATNDQFEETLKLPGVSAIACASSFHSNALTPTNIKCHLQDSNISVRPDQTQYDLQPQTNIKLLIPQQITIGIIDYRMGNLQSLVNAFSFLGYKICISSAETDLQKCDLLVLPGVGSFHQGILNLNQLGLDKFITSWIDSCKPFIGICLGMQILFESSNENGFQKGLAIIEGHVDLIKIPKSQSQEQCVLPHTGWNTLDPTISSPVSLFNQQNSFYQYFVHSYFAQPSDDSCILYTTRYADQQLTAAVGLEKTIGFQFHPERSGLAGISILRNTISYLMN